MVSLKGISPFKSRLNSLPIVSRLGGTIQIFKKGDRFIILSLFLCLLVWGGCVRFEHSSDRAKAKRLQRSNPYEDFELYAAAVLGIVKQWNAQTLELVFEAIALPIESELTIGQQIVVVDGEGRQIASGLLLEQHTTHFSAAKLQNLNGKPTEGDWVMVEAHRDRAK